ncbi:hypothetical protein NDU88_001949 [Pleurodeles waltl]|uniref:Uncharacterized protein n=1 Tax=Pleurodeles waltl TaxID=8319 RepID=A0AAV7W1H2_PLEWA|nr:hypothetical protein NDU88_001949 [Pleurodeles waltl]
MSGESHCNKLVLVLTEAGRRAAATGLWRVAWGTMPQTVDSPASASVNVIFADWSRLPEGSALGSCPVASERREKENKEIPVRFSRGTLDDVSSLSCGSRELAAGCIPAGLQIRPNRRHTLCPGT